jgi:hypothetical protein
MARFFAGLVQSPDCTLESLIISHTGRFARFAGTRMNDEIVQSLTDALAVNGSLMELGLNCNQGVIAAGWDIFCTGLRNPISVLKRLDLSSNSINDQVINSLVESIMVNNLVLQELDLSVSNNVTAMGWEPLSAVLQSPNSAIKVLRLGGNSFNDHTLASYVDALVDNSKLREFRLNGNRNVTAAGWDSFSAVLRNPTLVLEELYMGNNILNDQVIVSLADALTHNNKLRVLDLSNVAGLTELGWNALINLLFNQSSINGVFNSNHLLEQLWPSPKTSTYDIEDPIQDLLPQGLPQDLELLLKINRDYSVGQAARLKILMSHYSDENIKFQPFTGMHSSLLPFAWPGWARGVTYHTRTHILMIMVTIYCINSSGLCQHYLSKKKKVIRLSSSLTPWPGWAGMTLT